MKRALVLGFVAVLMVCGSGCSSNESLVKQYIADINGLAEAIEKNESADKIKAASDKLRATTEKMKKARGTKSEGEDLMNKYKSELEQASMRLVAAAAKHPEGKQLIQDALAAMTGQ